MSKTTTLEIGGPSPAVAGRPRSAIQPRAWGVVSKAQPALTDLQQAAEHRILPAVREGDTLVVTPRGELWGHSPAERTFELERLFRLVEDPAVRKVIFDLSDRNYFGSEMFGIFVQLKKKCVHETTALCGLSDDMYAMLKALRLDGMFAVYDSRRDAISALASVPVSERLAPERSLVPWMLVASIVLGVLVLRVMT